MDYPISVTNYLKAATHSSLVQNLNISSYMRQQKKQTETWLRDFQFRIRFPSNTLPYKHVLMEK